MNDVLKARQVVPLADAARALGVCARTLKTKMSEFSIPVVDLGPRSRGVKLADIDLLISNAQRPAVQTQKECA